MRWCLANLPLEHRSFDLSPLLHFTSLLWRNSQEGSLNFSRKGGCRIRELGKETPPSPPGRGWARDTLCRRRGTAVTARGCGMTWVSYSVYYFFPSLKNKFQHCPNSDSGFCLGLHRRKFMISSPKLSEISRGKKFLFWTNLLVLKTTVYPKTRACFYKGYCLHVNCPKTLNNDDGAIWLASIIKGAFCAPGSVPYPCLSHWILIPILWGGGIIISDLQMTKLRLREAKQLSKTHSK